jgi:hypothetical protein
MDIANNDIHNNSSSEIDAIYGKKLRVTCVERKYKVVDQKSSFIIVAKKEFDEDTTEKMLHEDMELKTFLANYEIANITSPSQSSNKENIKIQKKKIPEIEKLEIGKKEESESTRKRRDIIMATLKRRELFDSLDLPEEFLVKDYIEGIEKNGIKISNSAMPYDDLKWLAKQGKVKMVNKTERGVTTYKIIKTAGMSKIGSKSDNNQLDNDHVESILPRKSVIDRYVD